MLGGFDSIRTSINRALPEFQRFRQGLNAQAAKAGHPLEFDNTLQRLSLLNEDVVVLHNGPNDKMLNVDVANDILSFLPDKVTPLENLIDNLEKLPNDQRVTRFDQLLNETKALTSPKHRAKYFSKLADNLERLPDDQRAIRRNQLLNETQDLTSFIDNLWTLPDDQRVTRFDQLLNETKALTSPKHKAQDLSSLADNLWALPNDQRVTRFDQLLNETKTLTFNQEHEAQYLSSLKAQCLSPLAVSLKRLPGNQRAIRFDQLLNETKTLTSPEHKTQCLSKLANNLGAIPKRELLTRFDELLSRTQVLTSQEHKAQYLSKLAGNLKRLPEAEETVRFSQMSSQIFHRSQVPERFDQMLKQTKTLTSQEHKAQCLSSLADNLGAIPKRELSTKFDPMLRKEYLESQVPERFDQILNETKTLTSQEHKAQCLSSLANNLDALPEDQRAIRRSRLNELMA